MRVNLLGFDGTGNGPSVMGAEEEGIGVEEEDDVADGAGGNRE